MNRIPDGLAPILELYESYVAKLGKDILVKLGPSAAKNPKAYVDQLLDLHERYYSMNQRVFSSNPLFTAAVDKAFRSVVNDTQTNPSVNGPETLARYCDMMLRKTASKKDTAALSSGEKRKAPTRKITSMEADDTDAEARLMKMVRKQSNVARIRERG